MCARLCIFCFGFVVQAFYKNLAFALANWPGKVVFAEMIPASFFVLPFLSASLSEATRAEMLAVARRCLGLACKTWRFYQTCQYPECTAFDLGMPLALIASGGTAHAGASQTIERGTYVAEG